MKYTAVLLSIILLLFPFVINAQGEAAIPMLGLNPNPQSFGMGMSGVSLPTNDPLGFYYNPAILGYSSQTNNLSVQFYTDKVNWMPGILPTGTTYNNIGITAGYNFSKLLNGINLSAGVGFMSTKLDYGPTYYMLYDSPGYYFESYDQYTALGIGVSLDYFVNLSIGFTYKSIDSKLSPFPEQEARPKAVDWGMLINIPISKLTIPDYSYKPFENTALKPVVNFSLGYSRSNIGNEVSYIDFYQGDPLPLTARLGYTLSLGSDLLRNSNSINFFTFDISIESEDLLVSEDNAGKFSYQGLLGDIKPWQNLFEWKRTDNITLRKGQKLSLFETVSFLNGSYYNNSLYNNWTNGIIISTDGLFKLLSWNFNDNHYIKFFLEHFEIKYIQASWFYYSTKIETNMDAISLSFKGFIF